MISIAALTEAGPSLSPAWGIDRTEWLRRAGVLGAAEADADDAAIGVRQCVRHRQFGGFDRIAARDVGGQRDPDSMGLPGFLRAIAVAGEDLFPRDAAADRLGRGEDPLEVDRIVRGRLRGIVGHDLTEVLLGAQASRCQRPDFQEMGKVPELIEPRHLLIRIGWQREPVAPGDLKHHGRLDRTLKVDVQLDLGIAHENILLDRRQRARVGARQHFGNCRPPLCALAKPIPLRLRPSRMIPSHSGAGADPRTARGGMPLRNLMILIVTCAGAGLFVAACSSSSSSGTANAPDAGAPMANAGTAGTSGTAKEAAPRSAAHAPSTGVTDLAKLSNQAIIYTADLTLRVKDVSAAAAQASSEVAAAGGYVANEQQFATNRSSGGGEITLQLKIPVTSYHPALTALTKLGAQLSFNEQAEDVTQRVADVSSRVASAQAAIKQLRALLTRAGSIESLLSVQDEINSEESALESLLAQQTALAHETSYATVTVTFAGHHVKIVHKPRKTHRGLVAGLATGWRGLKLVVVWLLTAIGTLLPFAVPVVVIGGVIYVGRRRLSRRRTPPAAAPPAATT
jgi:hypothetical protein